MGTGHCNRACAEKCANKACQEDCSRACSYRHRECPVGLHKAWESRKQIHALSRSHQNWIHAFHKFRIFLPERRTNLPSLEFVNVLDKCRRELQDIILIQLDIVVISIHCVLRISNVESANKRLVICMAISLPFLAVRLVYGDICIFDNGSKYFSQFSTYTSAVIVHGLMGIFPEISVVAIYLFAGWTVPKIEKHARKAQNTSSV